MNGPGCLGQHLFSFSLPSFCCSHLMCRGELTSLGHLAIFTFIVFAVSWGVWRSYYQATSIGSPRWASGADQASYKWVHQVSLQSTCKAHSSNGPIFELPSILESTSWKSDAPPPLCFETMSAEKVAKACVLSQGKAWQLWEIIPYDVSHSC